MKKLQFIWLAALLAGLLAWGCDGDDDAASADAPPDSPDDIKRGHSRGLVHNPDACRSRQNGGLMPVRSCPGAGGFLVWLNVHALLKLSRLPARESG